MRRLSGAAWFALLSSLLVAGLILALHWLDPQYLPARHELSQYMLGEYGWLMRAALVLLAASLVALAYSLVVEVQGSSRLGAFLLLLAAFGFFFAALFPPGPGGVPSTLTERVHSGALGMARLAAVLGAVAAAWRARQNFGNNLGFALAIALAGAWFWLGFAPDGLTGWPDRAFTATLVVWCAALSSSSQNRHTD